MAWQGTQTWLPDGSLLLQNPRAILAGEKSMLDLQGYVQRDNIAVYAELEVKSTGKKPNNDQKLRISGLRKQGAIAGYADSIDKAREIFKC